MKEAEEISSNRHMNTLTLNRHTEILEILEIPQLMDTCVRNSYYEEALELAAYVRRLERKYSSIPVIQVFMSRVYKLIFFSPVLGIEPRSALPLSHPPPLFIWG